MSGIPIILAGAVSAEMGDEPHGIAEQVRGSWFSCIPASPLAILAFA